MYKGERFNSISHLMGAVAGLVGLAVLVVLAAQEGDPWKIVSCSIYGTTLFFLFTISTIYHSSRGRAKKLFQILDYNSIYLLIAGTYTPFTLVTLRGAWGWSIFGVVWGMATFGILLDSLRRNRRRIIPLFLYLTMGWVILVALGPLLEKLPLSGVMCLLVGGILYTVGVFFFVFDNRIQHFHGIWHLFVLAGCGTHYFAVLNYVL